MAAKKNQLVLFDIDGTMIDSGGAGMDSLRLGLQDAFPDQTKGKPFPEIQLGGATDKGLIDVIFPAYGLAKTDECIDRFFTCYCSRLKAGLKQSFEEGRGRALTGVAELVDAFQDQPNCYLGLLTGNIEPAAKIKLDVFHLKPELFPVGAYGDDFADRNKLGPVAIDRANQYYQKKFSSDEVYVIGDTTKDIACARACGAKVVAVATGAHSGDILSGAQPDWLFDDFSDYQKVVDVVISD